MPAFLCTPPRPMPNVIKLSKTGAHKKYPPRKVELGIFCFGKSCLLRGQDNDLSLVNGVGVHKTVGVALEDGLVLHQTGIFHSVQTRNKLEDVRSFSGKHQLPD